MSTNNIGFYEDLTKNIFELSSNIIKYAPYFFCCFYTVGVYHSLKTFSLIYSHLHENKKSDLLT